MQLEFDGEIIHWRGPSPFYFIPVPDDESNAIKIIANQVTYGWGVIPVSVRIGNTDFTTSLFPKDGGYLVPVKVAVRKAENIDEGDTVSVTLDIEE